MGHSLATINILAYARPLPVYEWPQAEWDEFTHRERSFGAFNAADIENLCVDREEMVCVSARDKHKDVRRPSKSAGLDNFGDITELLNDPLQVSLAYLKSDPCVKGIPDWPSVDQAIERQKCASCLELLHPGMNSVPR